MTISEKVAYIQGMFDGMDLGKSDSKEARILAEILDVLKEVGEELETVDAALDEFGEEIDAISDDLSDVEDAVFENEDDDDETASKKRRRRRNERAKNDVVLDESFRVLMDLIRLNGSAEVPEPKGWW